MVVVKNFSVRLVDAETKKPFKEHGSVIGETYAEVEPNQEYFIELQIIDGSPNDHFMFRYKVDGQDLGYRTTANRDGAKIYKGLLSRWGNREKQRALIFERPTSERAYTDTTPMMGSVQVHVWHALYQRTRQILPDWAKSQNSNQPKGPLIRGQGLKGLQSAAGFYNESKSLEGLRPMFSRGTHLCTITINYCSAQGLMQRGIIPRPPCTWRGKDTRIAATAASAASKSITPEKDNPGTNDMDIGDVAYKRIQIGGVYDNGIMIQAPREVDFFDLTGESAEARNSKNASRESAIENSDTSTIEGPYDPPVLSVRQSEEIAKILSKLFSNWVEEERLMGRIVDERRVFPDGAVEGRYLAGSDSN